MFHMQFVQQNELRPKCILLDYLTLVISVLNKVTFWGKRMLGFAPFKVPFLSPRQVPKFFLSKKQHKNLHIYEE